MEHLCRVNDKREDRLNYQLFHWPDLSDYVDVQQEYLRWIMADSSAEFNICNFPFLFDASAKTALLQADQALQMHSAMTNAVSNVSDNPSLPNYLNDCIILLFLGILQLAELWAHLSIHCIECDTRESSPGFAA